MPLGEFLTGAALHGAPGDLDPQAAVTGALLGIALFFVFALAMTLWHVVTHRAGARPGGREGRRRREEDEEDGV